MTVFEECMEVATMSELRSSTRTSAATPTAAEPEHRSAFNALSIADMDATTDRARLFGPARQDLVDEASNLLYIVLGILASRTQELDHPLAYGAATLFKVAKNMIEVEDHRIEHRHVLSSANAEILNAMAALAVVNEEASDAALYGIEILALKASDLLVQADELGGLEGDA